MIALAWNAVNFLLAVTENLTAVFLICHVVHETHVGATNGKRYHMRVKRSR